MNYVQNWKNAIKRELKEVIWQFWHSEATNGQFSPSLTVIKDGHGVTSTEYWQKKMTSWKNYYEHLYEDEDDSTKPAFALSEQEPPPFKSEIAWAIKQKHILLKGALVTRQLNWCTKSAMRYGSAWMESVFLPVPKKGDRTLCSD